MRRTRVRAHKRRGGIQVRSHDRTMNQATRDRSIGSPPRSFVSPGGRRFFVSKDDLVGDAPESWTVRLGGKRVGSLWITKNYGPTPMWAGNVKELVWSGPVFPPDDLGFDSGPAPTVSDLILRWSVTADRLLDYYAGKPVRSIYAGGKSHKGRQGYYQRSEENRAGHGRHPYEVTFEEGGWRRSWVRWSPNEEHARRDAREVLDREFPAGGARLVSVKRTTVDNKAMAEDLSVWDGPGNIRIREAPHRVDAIVGGRVVASKYLGRGKSPDGTWRYPSGTLVGHDYRAMLDGMRKRR